jgi:hypothetical protein
MNGNTSCSEIPNRQATAKKIKEAGHTMSPVKATVNLRANADVESEQGQNRPCATARRHCLGIQSIGNTTTESAYHHYNDL